MIFRALGPVSSNEKEAHSCLLKWKRKDKTWHWLMVVPPTEPHVPKTTGEYTVLGDSWNSDPTLQFFIC